MALIKCKECEKEISDTAKMCPNCGAKTEKTKQQNKKIKNIAIIIGVILILITIFSIYRTSRPLYKYSREAIEILENYKKEEITTSQACQKIKKIASQVEDIYKTNNNLKYLTLESTLSLIEAKIYLNDTNEIDSYIKELKKY